MAADSGGSLAVSDLASHTTVVRSPVATAYRGANLWVQPPVSQALLTPIALAALERSDAAGRAARVHTLIEAMTAAFAYRDMLGEGCDVGRLLDAPIEIDPQRALHRLGPRLPSHTTGIATADSDGRVVSMLISVFDTFGCATLVPGGGFLLNDRMTGFSADPASPAAAAPNRRPVHTLSPAILEHAGTTFALATPGADGQVQVIAQLIAEMVDHGTAPNQALSLPRWRSVEGRLHVERGFPEEVLADLDQRGHVIVTERSGAGHVRRGGDRRSGHRLTGRSLPPLTRGVRPGPRDARGIRRLANEAAGGYTDDVLCDPGSSREQSVVKIDTGARVCCDDPQAITDAGEGRGRGSHRCSRAPR